MMPLMRFMAVALLVSGMALLVPVAFAEPLDKDVCLKLQNDRKKLLTREMQSALDHGPDWVKNHLDSGEIEKVREFLAIEEQIEFRCRTGDTVAKALQDMAKNPDNVSLPDRKPTPPASTVAADANGTPLPDRNPAAAQSTTDDTKPSQALADSDKTAPSKTKATR
jgi:hypothetical protein